MADTIENKPKISDSNKDLIFKSIVFFVGVIVVKKTVKSIFGGDGRTDRVKYKYWATQYIFLNEGGDPPKFRPIDDPWTPDVLADELHSVMYGVAGTGDPGGTPSGYGSDLPRELAWKKILTLSRDRVRWLHNYWLDKIDSEDTLYRWIKGEIPPPWSSEDYTKEAVLKRLMDFGVGF